MIAGPSITEGVRLATDFVRSFAEVVLERLVVVVEARMDWPAVTVVLVLGCMWHVLLVGVELAIVVKALVLTEVGSYAIPVCLSASVSGARETLGLPSPSLVTHAFPAIVIRATTTHVHQVVDARATAQ